MIGKENETEILLIRKCSVCKIVKTLNEFCKNRTQKHGYDYTCYVCKKELSKQYKQIKVQCPICFRYTVKCNLENHMKRPFHKEIIKFKSTLPESTQIMVC